MLCEHLRSVEEALKAAGAKETYRGQPWSDNCREWVYFDRYLDLEGLRAKFPLAPTVVDHGASRHPRRLRAGDLLLRAP